MLVMLWVKSTVFTNVLGVMGEYGSVSFRWGVGVVVGVNMGVGLGRGLVLMDWRVGLQFSGCY